MILNEKLYPFTSFEVRPGAGWFPNISLSPDGKLLACAGKRLVVLELPGCEHVYSSPVLFDSCGWLSNDLVWASCVDGFVSLIDIRTSSEVARLEHPEGRLACATSPDNRYLVTYSGTDGHLRIWDSTSGKLIVSRETPAAVSKVSWTNAGMFLGGRKMYLQRVSFENADFSFGLCSDYGVLGTGNIEEICQVSDSTLAVADDSGPVHLVDSVTLNRRTRLDGHANGTNAVAVVDANNLATIGNDGVLKIWDCANARETYSSRVHSSSGLDICVIPESHTIVSSSQDRQLRFTDALNPMADGGKNLPQQCSVRSMAWQSDGRNLIATYSDGNLRSWDVDQRAKKETSEFPSPSCSMVVIDDDLYAITPDSVIRCGGVSDADEAPAGMALASVWNATKCFTVDEDGVVRTYSSSDGFSLPVVTLKSRVLGISSSATGALFGVVDETHWSVYSDVGKEIASEKLEIGDGLAVFFIGDEAIGVVSTAETAYGSVRVVALSNRQSSTHWLTEVGITRVAVSRSGTLLAVVDIYGNVVVYDSLTGDSIAELGGQGDPIVTSLAFSTDGDLVAAGSADGRICVWDIGY